MQNSTSTLNRQMSSSSERRLVEAFTDRFARASAPRTLKLDLNQHDSDAIVRHRLRPPKEFS